MTEEEVAEAFLATGGNPRNLQIYRDYQAGVPGRQLEKMHRITNARVHQIRHGVERRLQRIIETGWSDENLVARPIDAMSAEQIALAMRQYINSMPRRERNRERDLEIWQALRNGEIADSVAARHSICVERCAQILRKMDTVLPTMLTEASSIDAVRAPLEVEIARIREALARMRKIVAPLESEDGASWSAGDQLVSDVDQLSSRLELGVDAVMIAFSQRNRENGD